MVASIGILVDGTPRPFRRDSTKKDAKDVKDMVESSGLPACSFKSEYPSREMSLYERIKVAEYNRNARLYMPFESCGWRVASTKRN